ncbi:hypothetical protein HYE82_01435 [Streptomyces sp. BR123]|uniref:hypothetical protein n=1 Tax=Streptomyces sp. BR123 TaxID=2749828 RepID=UPI0015C45DAB|nr:hypothetical protein [Streptomyces sp. BR123]NXY93103.1 hypothetical protein [Streptomyces sp. BR123]
MAITRARKGLFGSLVCAVTAVVGVGSFGIANASPQARAAEADMPSAVEDFAYPGAAKIQQEQRILLKKGDGHLVLEACGETNDIQVKSRIGQKLYCFDVIGNKGYVALELPDAFGMWTEDFPVKATLTANGSSTTVNAPAHEYQPLGESGDVGAKSVLVELRVGY